MQASAPFPHKKCRDCREWFLENAGVLPEGRPGKPEGVVSWRLDEVLTRFRTVDSTSEQIPRGTRFQVSHHKGEDGSVEACHFLKRQLLTVQVSVVGRVISSAA